MCGIVGYIGKQNAVPFLLNGLNKLEYRGYDSAGIAILPEKGPVEMVKTQGRLRVLEEQLQNCDLSGCVGIGHTRWATHGEPADLNSHPHLSNHGDIAIVHNGIIENYLYLKERLIDRGYSFNSDTDTEVVTHLIDYYYRGNMIDALIKTMSRIEGSYRCV